MENHSVMKLLASSLMKGRIVLQEERQGCLHRLLLNEGLLPQSSGAVYGAPNVQKEGCMYITSIYTEVCEVGVFIEQST